VFQSEPLYQLRAGTSIAPLWFQCVSVTSSLLFLTEGHYVSSGSMTTGWAVRDKASMQRLLQFIGLVPTVFIRSASSPNGWKVIERFRDFIEKREWKLVRDVVKYARPAERLRGCQYVLEPQ